MKMLVCSALLAATAFGMEIPQGRPLPGPPSNPPPSSPQSEEKEEPALEKKSKDISSLSGLSSFGLSAFSKQFNKGERKPRGRPQKKDFTASKISVEDFLVEKIIEPLGRKFVAGKKAIINSGNSFRRGEEVTVLDAKGSVAKQAHYPKVKLIDNAKPKQDVVYKGPSMPSQYRGVCGLETGDWAKVQETGPGKTMVIKVERIAVKGHSILELYHVNRAHLEVVAPLHEVSLERIDGDTIMVKTGKGEEEMFKDHLIPQEYRNEEEIKSLFREVLDAHPCELPEDQVVRELDYFLCFLHEYTNPKKVLYQLLEICKTLEYKGRKVLNGDAPMIRLIIREIIKYWVNRYPKDFVNSEKYEIGKVTKKVAKSFQLKKGDYVDFNESENGVLVTFTTPKYKKHKLKVNKAYWGLHFAKFQIIPEFGLDLQEVIERKTKEFIGKTKEETYENEEKEPNAISLEDFLYTDDFDPKFIANEINRMYWQILGAVNPREFINSGWRKSDSNLFKVGEGGIMGSLSYWADDQINTQKSDSFIEMQDRIRRIVSIGRELEKTGNFFACVLFKTATQRWQYRGNVSPRWVGMEKELQFARKFQQKYTISGPRHVYRAYRSSYKTACIPVMPSLCQKLIYIGKTKGKLKVRCPRRDAVYYKYIELFGRLQKRQLYTADNYANEASRKKAYTFRRLLKNALMKYSEENKECGYTVSTRQAEEMETRMEEAKKNMSHLRIKVQKLTESFFKNSWDNFYIKFQGLTRGFKKGERVILKDGSEELKSKVFEIKDIVVQDTSEDIFILQCPQGKGGVFQTKATEDDLILLDKALVTFELAHDESEEDNCNKYAQRSQDANLTYTLTCHTTVTVDEKGIITLKNAHKRVDNTYCDIKLRADESETGRRDLQELLIRLKYNAARK